MESGVTEENMFSTFCLDIGFTQRNVAWGLAWRKISYSTLTADKNNPFHSCKKRDMAVCW